jgi:alpha-ketoglutarate-dependent taurine dioxygenase
MMNIITHTNGDVKEVVDFDIKTATTEQIHEIAKHVETTGIVVLKKQNLTPEDEVRITQTMGKIEDYSNYLDEPTQDLEKCIRNPRPKHSDLDKYKLVDTTDAGRKIFRVTGEEKHGVEGIFGHVSDLDWHCNRPWDKHRQPIIWLYGERGTKGSRTSWLNMIQVWNDLDPELQNILRRLKVINGHIANAYTEHNTSWMKFGTGTFIFYDNPQDIVYTNRRGITSLDFPFLQVHHVMNLSIPESEEIKETLTKIILNEKYMYHHDWDDGDIVISDQYMSLHKRWAFEGIKSRVVHRIAGNYDFTPL